MNVEFTIPGMPVGKGRPRLGRGGRVYTPDKTRAYEDKVLRCWQTQSGAAFGPKVPVHVSIRAYFPIPASLSEKKRTALEGTFHMSRPDADNIAKAILDALNGHAYPDDAAVQLHGVLKIYTNAAPRVEVRLWEAKQ